MRGPLPTVGDLPAASVYIRPLGWPAGDFHEVVVRGAVPAKATVDEIRAWADGRDAAVATRVETLLERLAAPPRNFAGLPLGRPLVMGIVNVTPDSFSDGGETPDPASAIERGRAMAAAGARIVDVGGESTRPGSRTVSLEEELERVVPVVRALAADGLVVSIDSRRAAVLGAALEAGAAIVNDVTALNGDPASLDLVAKSGAPVILMHMLGEPGTMQDDPRYDNAPLDIYDYLAERVATCEAAGIERARIAVDPGIGFGKTVAHNAEILGRLGLYHGLGCVVVLGASRKSFIGRLSQDEPAQGRIPGSLAAALAGAAQGVQIIRVHDVAETHQALAIWEAIRIA
jgi:dihydropteroate synthase